MGKCLYRQSAKWRLTKDLLADWRWQGAWNTFGRSISRSWHNFGRYCVSEFIAITLQGQFIVLHGVRNSLHGVNEFSVRSKRASVPLCIARNIRNWPPGARPTWQRMKKLCCVGRHPFYIESWRATLELTVLGIDSHECSQELQIITRHRLSTRTMQTCTFMSCGRLHAWRLFLSRCECIPWALNWSLTLLIGV